MDIFQVRNDLRTKSIFDLKLRVTFYARVSSDKDEQLNSLDNQVQYYIDFIKKNKSWTYVEGYIDEGISGISAKNRSSFQRMIREADENKFDLIITKEISRFARNTLDSIRYTRTLLSKGIGVFFQNDNINTIDEDSELRLTIMSSIAQDELRKLSSRIKFGHSQAIKNGVVIGNGRIFGYKKENKKLVIDEEEAPMIKLIFDLYATNEYSMKQIENVLYNKGYRNHNGNKISHTTLSNIIANPKYKGYYCGNKVKNIDLFTKSRKFMPEEEWVMYKDETGEIVPAIVEEHIWDKANEILKSRSLDVKAKRNSHNHHNLFTKKLYCTCCNQSYYMKAKAGDGGYKHTQWVCSGKIKNGKDSCKSFTLYEDELQKIIFDTFNAWLPNTDKIIEQYIKIAESIINDNTDDKNIEKLNIDLEKECKKQEKLLELLATDTITNADFKRMNDQITKKISELNESISNLEEKKSFNSDVKKRIDKIVNTLKNTTAFKSPDMINRAFILDYIEQINVTPTSNNTAEIDIVLLTGQSNKQNYTKPKTSRTGQTLLKMCPVQTVNINRVLRNVVGYNMLYKYSIFLSLPYEDIDLAYSTFK